MKRCNEILHDLREDKDMMQKEIAEIIGTSQQQYSKYESGDSEVPHRALIALAAYHGTSTDYLLGVTNIKNGIVGADTMLTEEYNAGQMVSLMANLTPERRAMAVEILLCLTLRQAAEEKTSGNAFYFSGSK